MSIKEKEDDIVKCKLIVRNLGNILQNLVLVWLNKGPMDVRTSLVLELELKRIVWTFVTDIYQCLSLSNTDLVALYNIINEKPPPMIAPIRNSHRFNFFNELYTPNVVGGGGEDDKYVIEYLEKEGIVSFYKTSLAAVFSPNNDVWNLRFQNINSTKLGTEGQLMLTVPKLVIILLIIVQNTMLILKLLSSPPNYLPQDRNTMNGITVALYEVFNSFEYGKNNKKMFSDKVRPDLLSILD